jgi:transglutaminase-like putative cysteine protease
MRPAFPLIRGALFNRYPLESSLMRTNTNAYKALIRAHILTGVYDYEGEDTEAARAAWIFDRFKSEYDYPNNRKRIPNNQARVAEWLSGLPLNIAYWNCDIRQLYETCLQHGVSRKQATFFA